MFGVGMWGLLVWDLKLWGCGLGLDIGVWVLGVDSGTSQARPSDRQLSAFYM